MVRDLRCLSVLVLVLAAASPMEASGFQLREQNPAAQGNSFAGVTAGAGGIGSSFFNPAVLADGEGLQVLAGFSAVSPRAELEQVSASRAAAVPGPFQTISGASHHGDAAQDAVLPNLYAGWAPTCALRLGLSVNAPYGLVTEYESTFAGRYHALKSDLKTVDVCVSAAYKLSDTWSLGLGVLYRKADAELTSAVDWGMVASALGTKPGTLDGTARIQGGKGAVGYKLGVLFTPVADLRVGLAYQPGMTLALSGNGSFTFPTALPAPLTAGLEAKGFRAGSVHADLRLPSNASLGIDWHVTPSLSLQGEAAFTGWSRFEELRVRFDSGLPDNVTEERWRDTWFYSLGLTWRVNDAWALRTGLAADQGAVPTAYRTPRIPDADRTWLSVGASWNLGRLMILDLGYSHILVKDGGLELSAGASPAAPNDLRGNLQGVTRSSIDVLALGARFRF